MKKNILIVGANSDTAKTLCSKYNNNYNFIKLSRNSDESIVDNFTILDSKTYYFSELKYDGIVYFPGSISLKPFKNLKTDDFYNDFNINVMGVINILKSYLPNCNENCSIIFISSVAAKIGMPFHSSIALSKSALIGLCYSLAAEYAPKYRFNCISPSLLKTKMSERFLRNDLSIEKIKKNNPLQKIGSTEDISSLINFLLSNDSKWITGQNISVDGGVSSLKI